MDQGLFLRLLTVSAVFSATPANAEPQAVVRLKLDPAPLDDVRLTEGVLPGSHILNGDADHSPDIVGPTMVLGFETAYGWVDGLEGAVTASVTKTLPEGISPPGQDVIRNYWGAARDEVDGAASLVGLDLSVGVDNAISADLMFRGAIGGVDGPANDFLLTDLFGDDSIKVLALDRSGSPIGEGLVIESGPGPNNIATTDPGIWGWVGVDLTVAIENLPDSLFGQPAGEGSVFDNLKVAAVAFDVEDLFEPDADLAPIHGLRIIGLELGSGKGSFDLGVAAVNRAAFVDLAAKD